MNKKGVIVAFSILLCSALLLGVFALQGNTEVIASTETNTEVKTITASGQGGIKVTPDVAYVNIGVVSENKELTKAQDDNKTKMNAVMKSLTDLGIKKEEIKTTNYYVSPKYDWNQSTGKSVIIGYTVTNTVEVTINDISKAGVILDKVVSTGSNNVSGLRFGLKDETALYNQALELAVKDAKSKAEAMGKGLGITNLEPFKISEISNRYQPMYAQKEMMVMDSVNSVTPISEGELEVTASVSVDFKFK